jgi:ornithine cyclodeaminase
MSAEHIEIFDDARVRALLPMPRVIAAMEEAFRAISSGQAQAPVRSSIALQDQGSRLLVMPASMPGWRWASVKIVSVCPENRTRGLETIHGLIEAFDARTGAPCARIHAESVTALRTGAASGLATRLLAPQGADTLALFGAGAQAATQLEAIHCVRPLREALVFGRDPARAAAFCSHWSEALGIPVRTAQRSDLARATLVATATTAQEPLFELDELHPEAHVNAVGSFTPQGCELPPALIAQARVVVDQRAACLQEAGEFHRARAAGLLDCRKDPQELGELLLDAPSSPATRHGRTVFKSVGNALQDLACVCALMELVRQNGPEATIAR